MRLSRRAIFNSPREESEKTQDKCSNWIIDSVAPLSLSNYLLMWSSEQKGERRKKRQRERERERAREREREMVGCEEWEGQRERLSARSIQL